MAGESVKEPGEVESPDERKPSPQRQAQLQAAYEANVAMGKAPYMDIEIGTLGEVLWILRERVWSNVGTYLKKHRANFKGVQLAAANLSGIVLQHADLSDAQLSEVNLSDALLLYAKMSNATAHYALLSGANLDSTDLAGIDLSFAVAEDTNFAGANLKGANLSCSVLREARFNYANLSGANLAFADLRGADLQNAMLDGTTNLTRTIIDDTTLLKDIAWNGARLSGIEWEEITALGEEQEISSAASGQERLVACEVAARTYLQLATALRGQGLSSQTSRFRLREQRLRRAAYWLSRRPFSWLGSLLLDWVSGYGELPGRAVVAYVVTILAFAGIYLGVAHFDIDQRLRHIPWYEWPALSITSFHGRGFFPGALPPHPWVTLLALLEAVIGLFLELVFIATFTRRFLGS